MTIVHFETKKGIKMTATAEDYIMKNCFEARDEKGEINVINKKQIKKILFCDDVLDDERRGLMLTKKYAIL